MSSSKNHFMKKLSFTALAMTFAFPAFAADANPVVTNTSGSLKIYGNLDSGIETVNNVGAGKARVIRVASTTGSTPSNLGFDMSKDAGGVKAIAKAEMGYYMDAGNSGQASKLFGRQLYVGVDSGIGSVTVGRQNNMMYWGMIPGDLLGPNIYGTGSIDPYLPNARYDNSIAWRGKFDAVSLGVAYSFGRDSSTAGTVPASGVCAGEVAGDAQACRAMSAMVQYDASNFGIVAAYDRLNGGATGAPVVSFYNGGATVALSNSAAHDTRTTLNGYFKMDAVKIGAGVLQHKAENATTSAKQSTTWLEAAYTMEKWVYMAGIFHASNGGQNTNANLYVLRATYNFDDQLSTYLNLGDVSNGSNSAYSVSGGGAGTGVTVKGTSQMGTMIGMRYRF